MRTASGGVWWCGGVPLGALGNGFQVVLAFAMTRLFCCSLTHSAVPLTLFFCHSSSAVSVLSVSLFLLALFMAFSLEATSYLIYIAGIINGGIVTVQT